MGAGAARAARTRGAGGWHRDVEGAIAFLRAQGASRIGALGLSSGADALLQVAGTGALDAIVAGARVTKGALYHHFSGKQALFEAAFERVEDHGARAIQRAVEDESDPWEKAQAGLRAFLDIVQEPSYRRLVVQDGPSVLGYERFREQEERSTFANVVEIVRAVLSAGSWELDEAMLQTFTRIFFGALSSAGDSVVSSDDPAAAAERVEAAVTFILAGLQQLAESGVELPGPTE